MIRTTPLTVTPNASSLNLLLGGTSGGERVCVACGVWIPTLHDRPALIRDGRALYEIAVEQIAICINPACAQIRAHVADESAVRGKGLFWGEYPIIVVDRKGPLFKLAPAISTSRSQPASPPKMPKVEQEPSTQPDSPSVEMTQQPTQE